MVTTQQILLSWKLFIKKIFGCHIDFDRSSALTGVDINRLRKSRSLLDRVIQVDGLLNAWSSNMFRKKEVKETTINTKEDILVFFERIARVSTLSYTDSDS